MIYYALLFFYKFKKSQDLSTNHIVPGSHRCYLRSRYRRRKASSEERRDDSLQAHTVSFLLRSCLSRLIGTLQHTI